MKRPIFLLAMTLILAGHCTARLAADDELRISLEVHPEAADLGDPLYFRFTMENVSDIDIKIPPPTFHYGQFLLEFTKNSSLYIVDRGSGMAGQAPPSASLEIKAGKSAQYYYFRGLPEYEEFHPDFWKSFGGRQYREVHIQGTYSTVTHYDVQEGAQYSRLYTRSIALPVKRMPEEDLAIFESGIRYPPRDIDVISINFDGMTARERFTIDQARKIRGKFKSQERNDLLELAWLSHQVRKAEEADRTKREDQLLKWLESLPDIKRQVLTAMSPGMISTKHASSYFRFLKLVEEAEISLEQ